MPKLSVIIPVYNAQKYIEECLNSVINQTLYDIEIICVNDGSTDNSAKILNSFRQKDSRIIILNQDNSGAGAARNYGLDKASGEYVLFIDSDDFIETDAAEKLYNRAKETDADIVICKARYYDNSTHKFKPMPEALKQDLLCDKDIFNYKDIDKYIFNFSTPCLWNKLCRRDFIQKNNLKFQNIKSCNDIYFGHMALVLADKITILPKVLLNYRINTGKSIGDNINKTFLCYAKATNKVRWHLNKIGIYKEVEQSYINFCISVSIYLMSKLNHRNKSLLKKFLKKYYLKKLRFEEKAESYFYFDSYWILKKCLNPLCIYIYISEEITQKFVSIQNQTQRFLEMDIKFAILHLLKAFKIFRKINPKLIPKKNLDEISIDICSSCNLNCRGCDHFSPLAEYSVYDLAQFEKDIKRLSELSNKNIGIIKLMGGEPLLNPDILQYCNIVRKFFPNTDIRIVSNGILIDKQVPEFYMKIRELNVIIEYTNYPINLNYSKFDEISERYGICIRTFSRNHETLKTSYKVPLDLNGKQDIYSNFLNCFHASNCLFLKNGKLYTCTVAPNIEYFNKYFHKNIPLSKKDGIDIYKAKNIEKVLKFLAKPIPFCKYCNVNRRTFNNKWGISNRDISEWIEED